MITQISYNVIIERFKAFASGHYLIERFTHGELDVTDIEKENGYPWMHVFPVSIEPRGGSRLYSFAVIFADLPRDKETPTEYQRESLSDCIRLAEDLLAEIQNGLVVFGPTVELDGSPSIEPLIQEFTHTLTGVKLELTLSVPWDWSACDIPADWSVGGTGSGGSGVGIGLVLRVNGVDNVSQDILDLIDGDNVTITDLGNGQVRFDATGGISTINWGDIVGTLSNQTDLVTALGLKANTADLGAVAFSNDYTDLDNLPTIPSVLNDLTDVDTAGQSLQKVLYYDGTKWIPYLLASVAYSGSYDDLSNKPVIPKTIGDLVGNGSAAGDVIEWDGAAWVIKALSFSLEKLSDVNVSPNPGDVLYWDDTAGEWINYQLAAVAYSGDYLDLGNKPTIPAAQIQSDWTQANNAALDYIKNKPTIPAAQVNSDWNASSGLAQILNKPTIPAAQIQSDWTQANTSALDYIKNKPTLPATVGDMLKSVYDTDNDGIVDFAEALKTEVRNSTGATLYKGSIIYLSGSTGNLPNAVLALATSDATSAQTFGVVYADIANNSDGFVITLGQINTLDTRTVAPHPFTADPLIDGDVLYLSPTNPGWVTNVKPVAPNHMVYVGMVVRTSPTNGTIQYRIQNGYELDELHNVVATSPANNDYMYYDSSTSLYRLRQLTAARITDSTTVGQALLTLPNPSAITYLRINANNTISALTLAQLKSDLGITTQISNVIISSDVTSGGANVWGDITGLSFAVTSGKSYRWRASFAASATSSSAFAINGPASPTYNTFRYIASNAAGTISIFNGTTYDGTTSAVVSSNAMVTADGFFKASANGTVTLRMRSATANTCTVRAGAIIEFQEVL
jgi:hypothetical protein